LGSLDQDFIYFGLESQIMTLQLAPSVGTWCFSELNDQHIETMQRCIDH